MDELALLDWKRRIFELYAEIRRDPDPQHAWRRWRETRDELFRSHPQTPIPAGEQFEALPYFDYDPARRRGRIPGGPGVLRDPHADPLAGARAGIRDQRA